MDVKRVFFSIAFLVITINASSTIYYISNNGDDSNTGTSITSPWKTIGKVNSFIFNPGDQVLFERGGVWREMLIIPSSGNAGNVITFGNYGDGNMPRILGSTLVESWANVSGYIWKGSIAVADPYDLLYNGNIYFVEANGDVTWGRVKKQNIGECVTEYDWAYSEPYIYIYSPTDPNTKYSGIEVTQVSECVSLNNKEYIEFDGLEIAYPGSAGIADVWPSSNLTGLTIKNCHIHHIGIKNSERAYGVEQWHSNSLICGNIIHDSGRRNISLYVYTGNADVHDIIIECNTIYNGFHTTGVDMSSQSSGTLRDVIIRRNYFYNEISATVDNVENFHSGFIYCSRDGSGGVSDIYIYYNIFRNIQGVAMSFGGVNGGPSSVYVYNNTVYGVSTEITNTYMSMVSIQSGSNVMLKNNIFYNDVQVSKNPTFSVINIASDAGSVILNNNLYYNTEATRFINGYGTNYSISQWEEYKSVSGQDANSLMGEGPCFVSPTDFRLQASSPAIDKGADVGLESDYSGKAIQGLPDIGAYEYGIIDMVGEFDGQGSFYADIFPNPASSYINIRLKSQFQEGVTIKLLNTQGVLFYLNKVYNRSVNIDVGNIPPGVYIIKITHKEKWKTGRVLIL